MKVLKEYGKMTVGDLVKIVKRNPKKFPNGMNTEIVGMDFEGNYVHRQFEVMDFDGLQENCITLNYELHEN